MAPEFPSVGHELNGTDWGVIYGPLGLMAAVFLALLVALWLWARSEVKAARAEASIVRAEADARVTRERANSDSRVAAAHSSAEERVAAARAAADEERDQAMATLRERDQEWQGAIRAIANEMAATTRTVTDKYHDHAVALRAVIESYRAR